MNEEDMECKVIASLMIMLDDKFSNEAKRKAMEDVKKIFEKQQKEIERLKEESIGDTKFDKLLFSIRMLHFHHYINDTQFEKMINKLSNEGE